MTRIIECVPNFSEGKDKEVIESISNAIVNTDGCSLLDVNPGISTNRTVYTFVGAPEHVLAGALNAARAAFRLIDMRHHHGEHPRMGAMDVCPFIPVQDATMQDCVEIAMKFGELLAAELDVPVYLYGEAADDDKRKALPAVRSGEYEGLSDKLKDPAWKPDFGPAEFVPSWGATAVGARKFLIAYNVNLLGTKEQAHRIALSIREQGPKATKLPSVRGIGWYLSEANLAQVSMNLIDFEVTGMHTAFEACLHKAKELNLAVVGSQIIGVVPLKALMESADFYMSRDNLFILDDDQKIRLVMDKLGLNSLETFTPKQRIIEYMITGDGDGPLVSMSVKDFVLAVGARTAAPGGGSVAALCASLGASLGSMVAFMTYGNRKFADLDLRMRKLIPILHKAMKKLMSYVDQDATAFSDYMSACKMLHETQQEIESRESAMQDGLRRAVEVPVCVAQVITSVWSTLKDLSSICNVNCRSDLQVCVRVLEAAVWGAQYNVLTNIVAIRNKEFTDQVKSEMEEALVSAREGCSYVLMILEERNI